MSHRRGPAARARVRRGADKRRKGIVGNDKGTTRAASSASTLVADKALHPIGKIQPQRIRCNPPDHVQSSRWDGSHRRCKHASAMTDDASARRGQPPSAARARQRRRRLPHRRLGPRTDQHALSLSPCFRGAFASGCSRCGPVPRCAVLKPRQVLLPPASAAIGPSNILQPSGRLGVLHH